MPADYVVQPKAYETALQYAKQAVANEIVVCNYVRLACTRFLDDLENAHERGFYFDRKAAQHAVDFFGFLRHTKGIWAKRVDTAGFVLAPWQVFIVANLFGWLRVDNGQRRFREAHLEIARKNGKSTFIAGMGLYMMFADGEPGAEVYAAATTKDQAKIVFHAARDMVKVSPYLSSRIGLWRNNIHYDETSSKFEPLASDSEKLDGLNIHCGIMDELHEHPSRALYDVLTTGTGSRSQALMLAITTAGFDREGICWTQRSYGIQILRRITPDDNFFVFIATLDDGDDWQDERNWPKANPNLGVSVSLEALRPNFIKAKAQPAALNEFLRKHLNVWTTSDTSWLTAGTWEKNCSQPDANAEQLVLAAFEKLKNRRCYGGLDLAECEDLVAFSLIFPPCPRVVNRQLDPTDKDKKRMIETVTQEEDLKWSLLAWFWIPEAYIEQKAKKNRAPYGAWVRGNFIAKTPGNTVAQEAIRNKILELRQHFRIGEVGYDQWGSEWLGPKLLADGVPMVKVPQRFEFLSLPTKSLTAFLNSGIVEHYNNPVMRWMASNVELLLDSNGNQRPDKGKSRNKIDGVVATVMAMGRALANPVAKNADDPDRFKVRML